MRSGRQRTFALAALAALVLLLLTFIARPSRAETLEAPVGGAAIAFGDGRVACTRAAPGGWVVDPSGRTVRPPTASSAVGVVVELRIAHALSACAQEGESVRLAATATWPTLDAASFTLAVDEGRLRGRGRSLAGVIVSWPSDQALGTDMLPRPQDRRRRRSLRLERGQDDSRPPELESPSLVARGGASHDRRGALRGGRETRRRGVVLDRPEPRGDHGSRCPRAHRSTCRPAWDGSFSPHPDAVTGVDCASAKCTVESDALLVQAPPAAVNAVDVKFRLAPRVVYLRESPPDAQPTVRVSILRCPMTVASGPPLRGIDGARAVVRVEGACMHDVASLGFIAGSSRVDVAQIVTTDDASYAVLEPRSRSRSRDCRDGGARRRRRHRRRDGARRDPPTSRHSYGARDQRISADRLHPQQSSSRRPCAPRAGRGAGAPARDDVYDASNEHGVTSVRGDVNAVGLVALQFGYRVATLPHPLDAVDLAVLTDALQRGVKEANVPAPFGLTANTAAPLVEVVCSDEHGTLCEIVPGVVLRLPALRRATVAASFSTASASRRNTERRSSRSKSRSTSSTARRGPKRT